MSVRVRPVASPLVLIAVAVVLWGAAAASLTPSAAAASVLAPNCASISAADVVAWWKGDGTSEDAVNAYDGVWEGGVPTYAPGLVGQSFAFDGTPGHIVRIASIAGFPDGADARTVEMWVSLPNRIQADADKHAMAFGYGEGLGSSQFDFQGFYVFPQAKNSELFGASKAGTLAFTASGFNASIYALHTNLVGLTKWHHVAVTYAGTPSKELRLYVDGKMLDVSEVSGTTVDLVTGLAQGASIGGHPALPAISGEEASLTGLIDEVTLYSRRLSPEEIVAIYRAGSSGKCLN